jgi:nitroreductase
MASDVSRATAAPDLQSDVFEVIRTQRAMRRLKPDPVPEELIGKVIWAATRAPSGGNRQGWRFLVVTDAEKRKRLQQLYSDGWERYVKTGYGQAQAAMPPEEAANQARTLRSAQYLADHLNEVPAIIIVCSLSPDASVNQGVAAGASIYPAVQNLMLAARALGLGTALTTIHRWNEDGVRELLGIPNTVDTAALIPLGWPKGHFGEGPRKPVEDVTYWENWGAKKR